MSKKTIGLLVMAYGTPYKLSDIKRYYTHIRQGREPSDAAVQDLKERYQAIGGVSPMAKITEKQAKALEQSLNKMQQHYEFKVYIGLRHIEPFIEDALDSMVKDGISEAVSIVLAPHYSTYSIKAYNERAKKAADSNNIRLVTVDEWYTAEGFIQYWSDQIKKVYDEMPEAHREKAALIISAHSLPKKILELDDPYVEQLEETARLISEQTNITDYFVGWQSEGHTPDPWLDPEVLQLTRDLYEKGYEIFVYAPVGFVSDHLEILYDNDHECKEVCDTLGAAYYRPEMPNTNDQFIDAMAGVVLDHIT